MKYCSSFSGLRDTTTTTDDDNGGQEELIITTTTTTTTTTLAIENVEFARQATCSQVWSSMAYDEALLFSYLWILPVTSFLLHCAEGSVNGFFSTKMHTTMPLAGSHQQRHFLLLWFLLPTSLTTQDSTAYSMFELGGAFRDHSLWDRCLCIAVSWEFELYVQFLFILVLRYEISLFDMGMMYPEAYFRFCIFGYQYILVGNSLIGYNWVTLLFTTNWNVFLE